MSDNSIKDALRMMPYGFYSITSRNGDVVNAMVANWISQVSYEPRLVALALQKTSYTHGLVEEGGVFAINIFLKEDQEIIMPFCKSRAKFANKMEEASYSAAPETGCPILDGAAAYVEFKVAQIIDIGGDHDIVVGEPVGAKVLKEAEAGDVLTLPHLGWSYAG
ncbi:MAG: flavin reductase family protein [Chloroflexota bacterium]|jgi:flavin reductase (DIM6/NTAB) family NADH-FMN oxidoreductase RutF